MVDNITFHGGLAHLLSEEHGGGTCTAPEVQGFCKAKGRSVHQDDAAKLLKMLLVKQESGRPRCGNKWKKTGAQLDESLQTGAKPSRPITRASFKQELKSKNRAKIINIDDGTFIGDCIKLIPGAETSKGCPSIEIIDVESSAETSAFPVDRNLLMHDYVDFISRALVKEEILAEEILVEEMITDTHRDDHELRPPEIGQNTVQPMEPLPEKGQSQPIASEHENEIPKGDSWTGRVRDSSHIGNLIKDSHGNGHKLESPNKIGLKSGGQSMNPQPEKGQSESIASLHENKCSTQGQQTCFHECNSGLGSSNRIGSNFRSQPVGPRFDDDEIQSIPSEQENDCLKGTSATGLLRNSSRIKQAIRNKYGDITQGCILQSDDIKNRCLEGICNVVQKLHDTRLADMKSDDVEGFYSFLKDAESLKFDVSWLRQRVDEIVKVKISRDELKKLKEELKDWKAKEEELDKALDTNTVELAKLKHKNEKLKEQKNVADIRVKQLNVQIMDIESICSPDYVMHGWL